MRRLPVNSRPTRPSGRIVALAVALAVVLGVAGCASGGGGAGPIRVGWAAVIPALDPVVGNTPGSFALLSQVHGSLVAIEEGEPVLDLALSADFTADGEYTVVLKPSLTFANGNGLTASDVVFSIERQQALQVEDGPWRELANVEEVEAIGDTTIVFHLGSDRDAGFPFVLAGQAGLILDEESFFADEVTPDDVILDATAFGGPFTMAQKQGVTTLKPFPDYAGERPAASVIELRAGDAAELAADLVDGSIDVLTGRYPASVTESLSDATALATERAASGRVRLLAFDLDLMPFGASTPEADPVKALAVRNAVADVIDREDLVRSVGPNLIAPLTDYLPKGLAGANDLFTDITGDGLGGADVEKAAADLAAAGITIPVELTIHLVPDEIGGPATEETQALAAQLEASDLFSVTLVEVDSDGLEAARDDDEVSILFTSIVSGTLDPQAYLEPYLTDGTLAPGYSDVQVDDLLARQRTELDPAIRAATLDELQTAIAVQLPVIPISQGVRLVFSNSRILGVTLQDSVPLDLSALSR